ncbi:hypothetical protein TESG_08587 [Trichophyton tonsurans CBS 112818]|uniref:Uncharacterized protein n=1 Tax=Trichophyton tonsurans (strain CBS 112818) TaxID=647933 RepID=F2S6M4_TRIT1|nr:hypothetical protein TESG_08587 [Trichophyton tonsurans CBS 112818]
MMIMIIMEYYQLSKSGKALSNDFASIPRTLGYAVVGEGSVIGITAQSTPQHHLPCLRLEQGYYKALTRHFLPTASFLIDIKNLTLLSTIFRWEKGRRTKHSKWAATFTAA